MKLILRIGNVFPLFLAFLLLGTVWSLGWEHIAKASSPVLQKLAGAALYQWS